MRHRKTLLVGAYERDNFGDILFLLVTEHYLHSARVKTLAGAPFASDMTGVFGRHIVSAGSALRRRRFGCVWTVGGEVGPITPLGALSMAERTGQVERVRVLPPDTRLRRLSKLLGGPGMSHPYLPDVSHFRRNAKASYVLNSAGLSGLAARGEDFQETALSLLRRAAGVSVRDQASSDYLDSHGVTHTLAPDLIHVIGLDAVSEPPTGEGPVVFQASKKTIDRMGVEALASALASCDVTAELGLKLVTAGTAPHHDSAEAYQALADAIGSIRPGFHVQISSTIDPWQRVRELQSASLVIASSLHCRIVACARDVPRVSLVSRKTTRYADQWDSEMPTRARPESLSRDIEDAMSPETVRRAAGTGSRLAQLADDNIRSLMTSAGLA